jgi:hypothetical protein
LVGTIPSFIGELAAMQYMTFGINALSGSIPKELGNLTNLVSLGFSSNNFSGSLPSELGSLFKLEELCVSTNNLSLCSFFYEDILFCWTIQPNVFCYLYLSIAGSLTVLA